jgi:MFS family permease
MAAVPRTVPIMATAFMVAQLPLALLTIITASAPAYLVLAAGGAAFVIFQVTAITVLQRAVPPRALARVWSILVSLGCLGTLVGSLAGPTIAHSFGLTAALLVPAGIGLLIVAMVSRPLVHLNRTNVARAQAFGDLAAAVARIPVFTAAPRAAQERLASSITVEELTAGDVPIREGDPPDDFFVIRAGHFEVTVGAGENAPQLVNTMGPGDWFGEIGLIHRRTRTATVTAAGPATVWRIPGDDFLDALELGSTLPGPLSAGIGQRLDRTHPNDIAVIPTPKGNA